MPKGIPFANSKKHQSAEGNTQLLQEQTSQPQPQQQKTKEKLLKAKGNSSSETLRTISKKSSVVEVKKIPITTDRLTITTTSPSSTTSPSTTTTNLPTGQQPTPRSGGRLALSSGYNNSSNSNVSNSTILQGTQPLSGRRSANRGLAIPSSDSSSSSSSSVSVSSSSSSSSSSVVQVGRPPKALSNSSKEPFTESSALLKDVTPVNQEGTTSDQIKEKEKEKMNLVVGKKGRKKATFKKKRIRPVSSMSSQQTLKRSLASSSPSTDAELASLPPLKNRVSKNSSPNEPPSSPSSPSTSISFLSSFLSSPPRRLKSGPHESHERLVHANTAPTPPLSPPSYSPRNSPEKSPRNVSASNLSRGKASPNRNATLPQLPSVSIAPRYSNVQGGGSSNYSKYGTVSNRPKPKEKDKGRKRIFEFLQLSNQPSKTGSGTESQHSSKDSEKSEKEKFGGLEKDRVSGGEKGREKGREKGGGEKGKEKGGGEKGKEKGGGEKGKEKGGGEKGKEKGGSVVKSKFFITNHPETQIVNEWYLKNTVLPSYDLFVPVFFFFFNYYYYYFFVVVHSFVVVFRVVFPFLF